MEAATAMRPVQHERAQRNRVPPPTGAWTGGSRLKPPPPSAQQLWEGFRDRLGKAGRTECTARARSRDWIGRDGRVRGTRGTGDMDGEWDGHHGGCIGRDGGGSQPHDWDRNRRGEE